MATLDATTQAEYAAEVNASARAQVVIDALSAPVYGRVYNQEDAVMGEGVFTEPWATTSGNKLFPSTLDNFFVINSAIPNDGWRFKFESGSRYLSLTFGLVGSGKETIWSSSFDVGTRAGIISGEITVAGNQPPVWSGAPAALVATAGSTQNFSSYVTDPDGDQITFSLVSAPSGYSITAAGVLTIGSTAQSVTIRATDPDGASADWECAVTIQSAGSVKWNPGHYVWPIASSTQRVGSTQTAHELAIISSIASEPTISGILIHKYWYYLEGAQGDYSAGFAYIDQILAALAAAGNKRLIMNLTERAFGGTTRIVPPYVAAAGWSMVSSESGLAGNLSAWSRLWISGCANAYLNMMKAYAARYDGHPLVEMIGGPETSTGAATYDPTWSWSGHMTFWKRYLSELSEAWRHTMVRYAGNYFGTEQTELQIFQYLHQVAANCAQRGYGAIAVGGPDPRLPQPNPTSISWTHKLFRGESLPSTGLSYGSDSRGVIPYIDETQEQAFIKRASLPADLGNEFYNNMLSSHVSWMEMNYTVTPPYLWTTGILPYVRSVNGRVRSTPPTTVAGRTITGGI